LASITDVPVRRKVPEFDIQCFTKDHICRPAVIILALASWKNMVVVDGIVKATKPFERQNPYLPLKPASDKSLISESKGRMGAPVASIEADRTYSAIQRREMACHFDNLHNLCDDMDGGDVPEPEN
jgi:hypothetical protein